MALFRRRATPDEVPPEELRDDLDAMVDEEADPAGQEHGGGGPGHDGIDLRTQGPFDVTEADSADQELPRLDLGSLRIPGLPGVGVQVEADQATNEVRAVTAVVEDAAVQLQAFAAPRSEGLWAEIRDEMLAEIRGTADTQVAEAEGPYGPELRAVIPARTPDGQQVLQPLRFAGIDGPRWFLRVVFLGRAAVEPDPDDLLHDLVRQTIVVRGPDAMAPRDPLPLRLPEQPPAGVAELADGERDDAEEDDAADRPSRYAELDPFERGPEITETR
ncbi:MAG TPA: DUF3710 domain-containing protein [Candidatus Nanopelagicales bacterium]